ncbi:MAG: condensation domain-containing protein, partial [Cyanobacteria bacterium J06627_32]
RIRAGLSVELPLRQFFDTPTIALLATAVETVVSQGSAQKFHQPIKPTSQNNFAPLSSTQQRLWLLNQLESSSTAYNLKRALRLTGELDLSLLKRSLQEIVDRHAVLRTTFRSVDGRPVQVIHSSVDADLTVVNLRAVGETFRQDALSQEILAIAAHQFDLQKGPVFRFGLIALSDTDHVLVINIHHIAFDGWSFRIFFKELSALYSSFYNGLPSPLPELDIQYLDFACWQQNWLQSEAYQSQLQYWKEHLRDAESVLNLPTDYKRPPVQTYSGATYSQRLSYKLKEELHTLSRQTGTTLFMTMLAAFKTLCYRFTQQKSLTVGSPIAGRNQKEVEPLIGFFVSNLVLHSVLSEDISFLELLKETKQNALEAYAHQSVPFEALLKEINPPRDLSRTPLFQVWFNMVNLGELKLSMPGLSAKSIRPGESSARFDLTVYVREGEQGLFIQWLYNRDLFKESTIAFMSSSFETLLNSIVSAPEQLIGTMPMLSPAQQKQLLPPESLKTTSLKFPHTEVGQSIPARFAAQVEAYRSRVA